MRLQADCQFQQTKIEKLNKEYDVDMYSTNLRGGKHLQLNKKFVIWQSCCWEINVLKNCSVNELNQTN